MSYGTRKQPVDSFTFVLLYILGMLFLRIPNDFLIGKLVSFCLVVGAALLCFVASQQEER
jgi:hypothetical protein